LSNATRDVASDTCGPRGGARVRNIDGGIPAAAITHSDLLGTGIDHLMVFDNQKLEFTSFSA